MLRRFLQPIYLSFFLNLLRYFNFYFIRHLSGGGAWTAGIPNNRQYLSVDLGYRHVVTGVATQGRRGSYEYVTEYYIEYSDDNQSWNIYTNRYDTPLVRENTPPSISHFPCVSHPLQHFNIYNLYENKPRNL